MPQFLPFQIELVYISGAVEIILGIMAFFPISRSLAFLLIAAMLVCYLPVHFDMLRHAPFRLGGMTITVSLAWIRLILQVPLIIWALWQRGF